MFAAKVPITKESYRHSESDHMSIHPNADGSQTDGLKVEPWGKFVSH